jgi:hypothetical protein
MSNSNWIEQRYDDHGNSYRNINKKRKSKVPERWEQYKPFGVPIEDTRLIAFKVPLLEQNAVPEEDGTLFTPQSMLSAFREKRYDIGLVVDLTFTTKYYGPHIIDNVYHSNGIDFYKLPTMGQVIPHDDKVVEFQRVVGKFLKENPTRLVGVHCTHGLNRTGYMICRFLIEKLRWDPDHAIAAFDTARGHKQERENYLADLRRLSSTALLSHDEKIKDSDRHQMASTSRSHGPLDRSLGPATQRYRPYQRFDPYRQTHRNVNNSGSSRGNGTYRNRGSARENGIDRNSYQTYFNRNSSGNPSFNRTHYRN